VQDYLTNYYQTVYDDNTIRSLSWASSNLVDYYTDITTHIASYPAYNWPMYVRYSVFPDIYGYFEVPKLVEFWNDKLNLSVE
jgi:hypothetical protein